MRARALLLAALAAGAAPAAADVGARARFAGGLAPKLDAQATPGAAGELVFETGPSAPLDEDGDTVLFHGESAAADLRFEVARRLADGSWTPWLPAYVQRYPNGRFWGKAEVPYGRGELRIRAFSRVRPAREIKLYAVEVFRAGDQEPQAQGGSPAAPAPGHRKPSVHGRQAWNAVAPKADYEPHAPDRFTLHHTEGRYTTTLADTFQEARVIQDFHMRGRGWADIAYHYLIDPAGNIVEGRPELVVGAHAGDERLNTGNLGVVFLGSYHPPKNDAATPAAVDAFLALGRYFLARYKVKPASLKGHRDMRRTDCPGDGLYALLPRLRGQLSSADPRRVQPIFRPIALVHPRFD